MTRAGSAGVRKTPARTTPRTAVRVRGRVRWYSRVLAVKHHQEQEIKDWEETYGEFPEDMRPPRPETCKNRREVRDLARSTRRRGNLQRRRVEN
jgi:hypothetical protein